MNRAERTTTGFHEHARFRSQPKCWCPSATTPSKTPPHRPGGPFVPLFAAARGGLGGAPCEAIHRAGQETPEALRELETMLDAVRERSRRIPPKLISGFFLPALRSMFQRFAAAEGRRRAALVALGIERFRQSQHRLPTALENLVPDYLSSVPVDIVTGEAMKLEVLDKGYKVYSSGADGMVPSSRERSNEKAVSVIAKTFFVER